MKKKTKNYSKGYEKKDKHIAKPEEKKKQTPSKPKEGSFLIYAAGRHKCKKASRCT